MKLAAPIFRSLIRVRGAYLVCTRGKAKSERQFAGTDDFLDWLANEAVKDAWEQNRQAPINESKQSKTWTRFSGNLGDQYTKDRSTIRVLGLGSAYGALSAE